ncbi:hypothetical protein O3M35_011270 [Rhynocoris fuscipes]|uniref:Uncharacterized protein n=1 Tax=Rhynocoris fuscipes TaxID=488301 RepID=A0AAW1D2C4_9HEMI
MRRLYQNLKSVGPKVLPTEQVEFCVYHILRTTEASINFFYSILILINKLDLISFWAITA